MRRVLRNYRPNKFQTRRVFGLRLNEAVNDCVPEAGQRFVITAIYGVLPTLSDVVSRDGRAQAIQRGFTLQDVAGAKSQMCSVGPLRFRQRSILKSLNEAIKRRIVRHEIGKRHGLL